MGRNESATSPHRSSTASNGFSALPEVDTREGKDSEGKQVRVGEGKETVVRGIGGLEVHSSNEKQHLQTGGIEVAGSDDKESVETRAHYADAAAPDTIDGDGHANQVSRRRRRRAWLIGGVVLLLILGIALGVGLGVGMQNNGQDSADGKNTTDPEGSSAPSYTSTRGAFNGSAISIRRQASLVNLTSGEVGTSDEDARNLLLVFQHHSGDVRWMQRVWPNTWQGGSESETTTAPAKNGTPLSFLATDYKAEGKTYWHVFCKPTKQHLSIVFG